MKALKRTLADVAIEARMAVGTAPVWRERMGEGVEESTSSGQGSFHSDRSKGDGHEDSFTGKAGSGHPMNFFPGRQSAAGRLDVFPGANALSSCPSPELLTRL